MIQTLLVALPLGYLTLLEASATGGLTLHIHVDQALSKGPAWSLRAQPHFEIPFRPAHREIPLPR